MQPSLAEMRAAARRLPKNPDYQVVWHGGKVDSLGTRGGLLPEYESESSWVLTERYLRLRRDLAPELEEEDGRQVVEGVRTEISAQRRDRTDSSRRRLR